MERGFREDVFHNAAGESLGTLIVLLCDVYSQTWLDVFVVLAVHALASAVFRR